MADRPFALAAIVLLIVLGVYLAVIAEPSLLAVAAISGGAALCSLVEGGLQPSRR